MSIGFGIFLSTLLINAIYLFPKIRNWPKIIKTTIFIIFGVPFLIWLYFFAEEKYQSYPRKISEYWGIKLGDDTEKIEFYKGFPTYEFLNYHERFASDKQKYKFNNIIEHTSNFKPFWVYIKDDVQYDIEFTKDKILKRVICGCIYGKSCYSWSCPKISSIGINSSFEDIVKVFGYPDSTNYEKRYGLRFLKYPKYNLTFRLKENEVYRIIYEY